MLTPLRAMARNSCFSVVCSFGFTLALLCCLSCASRRAAGTVPEGVHYWERVPEGHVMVAWFPEEDCRMAIRNRPEGGDGVHANCNAAELAEGRRLLGTEAWKEYESVDIPSPTGAGGADDNTAEMSGADTSGALDLPPTGDIPVGSIKVTNGQVQEGQRTKTFWADDLGPKEAELVAYFRALHKKYRRP